jgi:RecB family exonuclease
VAVARALDGNGDCSLLAGLLAHDRLQPLGTSIDAGLRFVHARSRGDSFGPAEGLLTSPAAATRFAERFGPNHLWSPSQWETYAACPYKFFLENVLGIEPLGELVLETDHMRRGSRLHQVLADFHRRWSAAQRQDSKAAEDEAALFLDELTKVVNEGIAATPRTGIDAALNELDRRQILKWGGKHFEHHARYTDHCAKHGEGFAAMHFELRFGPPHSADSDSDDPHSCDKPFLLDIDGECVQVTGRIDRIDVAQIGDKFLFNVIDYKSGRRPSLKQEHIATGEHLQLPIYVEAAQALLFEGNARPAAAGYWSMAAGFDSRGVLADLHRDDAAEHWSEISDVVRQRIAEFVRAIRQGSFPVASRDDQCTSRCEFNTVCRIAQVRSLAKTWPPPQESAGKNQASRQKSQESLDTGCR